MVSRSDVDIRRWVEANPGRVNDLVYGIGGDSRPPLYEAVTLNLPLVLWLLDEKGADVNAKCCFGQTALHWTDRVSILNTLMEHGADPTLLDLYGKSALTNNVRSCCSAVVACLLSYPRARETVDLQDCDGETCLHLASGIYRGNDTATSITHDLLEAGANPVITNKHGERHPRPTSDAGNPPAMLPSHSWKKPRRPHISSNVAYCRCNQPCCGNVLLSGPHGTTPSLTECYILSYNGGVRGHHAPKLIAGFDLDHTLIRPRDVASDG